MRIVRLSEIRDELQSHIRRQEIFPIIGSGFTRGCKTRARDGENHCVPSGQDMQGYMKKYLADHGHPVPTEYSFSKIARYYERFADKSDIIQYFKQHFIHVDLNGLRKDFLSLNWKLVYTLNLDDAIERNSPYQFKVLPNRKDLQLDAISDEKCVFKLHGDAEEFIKYGDSKDTVLSFVNYITSLSTNRPLLEKLRTDLDYSNTLFIGCSLSDELDLLDVAQQLKANLTTQKNRYFVTDKQPDEFLMVDLEDYLIDTVIRVDNYDSFYRDFIGLARESISVNGKELDEFRNIPCRTAPPKNNIDYLLRGRFLLNKGKKAVFLPEFFIERDVGTKILQEMHCNEIQIIHGPRVSGKTYLLAGLLHNIHDRDTYYFDSREQVNQSLLDHLLTHKNSVFLFDTNVLSIDAIESLIKTGCTQLKNNRINVICCINNSDREILALVGYEKRHLIGTSSGLQIYELKGSFSSGKGRNTRECERINKKLKLAKQKLLPFSKNQTILDNLLYMQKKLQIKKAVQFDHPLDIAPGDVEKICLLILLALNERVTASELVRCGLTTKSSELLQELKVTIEEDHRNLLTLNSIDSVSYQIVCNAKVWLLNQVREVAKKPALQQTIVDAFKRLIEDFLGNTRQFKRVERFVKFDKLNEIFPDGKRLVVGIYEGLNPVLNESYQYYHQYAKCHLWGMASPGYEKHELEEARIAALTALNMITDELDSSDTLPRQIAHAHILNTLTIVYTKLCFLENFQNEHIFDDTVDYFYQAIKCEDNYGAMCRAKYSNRTAKEEEGGVLKRWISRVMSGEAYISSENSGKINEIVTFWKKLSWSNVTNVQDLERQELRWKRL